jgi:tetratricopeptide (TPR) repeat protein
MSARETHSSPQAGKARPRAARATPAGTDSAQEPAPLSAASAGPNRLREWLTFGALALLVYHLLALWYRWLRPDPEFLAFSGGVAELLAILSFLGLQTEPGRRVAARLDSAVGGRQFLGTPRRACLAAWAAVLVTGLLLYAGSPLAANLFNRHGAAALEEGRYSVAARAFQQAASLCPRDSRAHYNLAGAYAALHDDEKAIDEYQVSLELDEAFWPAYNNLGYLYLQARQDPDAALTVLLAGERRVDDALGQAIMAKNIGWAYLEKGLPRAALGSLEAALAQLGALRADGESVQIYLAESHRLEALAAEELGQSDDARRAWQDSLGYALAVAESEACAVETSHPPPDCLDAIRWVAEAREWLYE